MESLVPTNVPSAPVATKTPARCSFTVDVEDWYQSCADFDAPISERVVRNMDRVLEALDDAGVKATFFVQGLVAEAFPKILQDALAAGHEIQSHGHSHRPLYSMDRRELRRELELSIKSIEDACGVRVNAFRAPDFSILKQNLWALEELADIGFTVDSSLFPIRMKRYGLDDCPTRPHRLKLDNGLDILEAP
ncbi:MAG: polysaccharide deacetylase family protein, partial [Pirellulales bacterium]|nr:polysaccharide deacetylase family protein [Pirellulales bacterium]